MMEQSKYMAKYDEMEKYVVGQGISRRLIHTDNLMMVNVEFVDGPCDLPDPFHAHPHEQVSYLAEGEVFLFVDDEPKVHLKAGDHFAIPSGVPHSIQRLSAFVRIIDCFTPLREEFLAAKKN